MTDLTAERVRYSQSLLLAFAGISFGCVFALFSVGADQPAVRVVAYAMAVEWMVLSLLVLVTARGAVYNGYCRQMVELVKEYPNRPYKELAEERDADV